MSEIMKERERKMLEGNGNMITSQGSRSMKGIQNRNNIKKDPNPLPI